MAGGIVQVNQPPLIFSTSPQGGASAYPSTHVPTWLSGLRVCRVGGICGVLQRGIGPLQGELNEGVAPVLGCQRSYRLGAFN